jgi:hypothetical protein
MAANCKPYTLWQTYKSLTAGTTRVSDLVSRSLANITSRDNLNAFISVRDPEIIN